MIDRSDWPRRSDDLLQTIKMNSFDMVMTNPPFGQNLVVEEDVGRKERLDACQKWSFDGTSWAPNGIMARQQLGIVFFERNMNLLKKGGRLAIVLPETFLFSYSFKWFVLDMRRVYNNAYC